MERLLEPERRERELQMEQKELLDIRRERISTLIAADEISFKQSSLNEQDPSSHYNAIDRVDTLTGFSSLMDIERVDRSIDENDRRHDVFKGEV